MSTPVTTVDLRLAALRRFSVAITALNLLGHSVLGFEPSWAQSGVGLLTAYGLELLLEWIQARSEGRTERFRGGFGKLVDFLLPAHITGLAVSMLLFANDRLLPVAFAVAVAIGSKVILIAPTRHGYRHFMNPSNCGLVVAFLALPGSVAAVVPYQYSEELSGYGDWILPCVVIFLGSFLNGKFTGRLPLILGWLAGFVTQALIRSLFFGAALSGTLAPMTGFAFLLFTFYMISDPGTTPSAPGRQVAFGLAVAWIYGVLVVSHVAFGLFFSLAIVCVVRGVSLHVAAVRNHRVSALAS